MTGILIRGGDILERAQCLDTVVFDKTGTRTRGEPVLAAFNSHHRVGRL